MTTLFAPEQVAQAVQGAVPELDQSVPGVHAEGVDAHTVLAVAVQAEVTAPEQVAQGVQGAVPADDQSVPAVHAAGAAQNPVIARQAHVPLEQVTVCPDGQLEGGVLGHLEQ